MTEFYLKIGDRIEIRLAPGDRADWEDVKRIVDAYYAAESPESDDNENTDKEQ